MYTIYYAFSPTRVHLPAYMRANTHTHTRTHAHTHTRTHAHTHTRTHARTRTHTHTRTHAHAHTRARAHTHTRTRAHAHTRTRARTHARTHAHAHTHTHTRTGKSKEFVFNNRSADDIVVIGSGAFYIPKTSSINAVLHISCSQPPLLLPRDAESMVCIRPVACRCYLVERASMKTKRQLSTLNTVTLTTNRT